MYVSIFVAVQGLMETWRHTHWVGIELTVHLCLELWMRPHDCTCLCIRVCMSTCACASCAS